MALSTSPTFCAIECCLFELTCDRFGVLTVVPFDHQRRQPFLGSPQMVGHDSDGVVEPYDLTHALDRLGGRIIHALHATAEHRRFGGANPPFTFSTGEPVECPRRGSSVAARRAYAAGRAAFARPVAARHSNRWCETAVADRAIPTHRFAIGPPGQV
jgi:hypothetical protein